MYAPPYAKYWFCLVACAKGVVGSRVPLRSREAARSPNPSAWRGATVVRERFPTVMERLVGRAAIGAIIISASDCKTAVKGQDERRGGRRAALDNCFLSSAAADDLQLKFINERK